MLPFCSLAGVLWGSAEVNSKTSKAVWVGPDLFLAANNNPSTLPARFAHGEGAWILVFAISGTNHAHLFCNFVSLRFAILVCTCTRQNFWPMQAEVQTNLENNYPGVARNDKQKPRDLEDFAPPAMQLRSLKVTSAPMHTRENEP